MPVENFVKERSETKKAARSLTSNRCHHEPDVNIPMKFAEYLRLDLKQLVMKLFLWRGKFNDHGFRFADRELPDIAASRSIDYPGESMQRLEVGNQLYTLFRSDFAF